MARLTREQKARLASILKSAQARHKHCLVHAKTDEERDFYRGLIAEVETVLPIFTAKGSILLEDDEPEDEDGEDEA